MSMDAFQFPGIWPFRLAHDVRRGNGKVYVTGTTVGAGASPGTTTPPSPTTSAPAPGCGSGGTTARRGRGLKAATPPRRWPRAGAGYSSPAAAPGPLPVTTSPPSPTTADLVGQAAIPGNEPGQGPVAAARRRPGPPGPGRPMQSWP